MASLLALLPQIKQRLPFPVVTRGRRATVKIRTPAFSLRTTLFTPLVTLLEIFALILLKTTVGNVANLVTTVPTYNTRWETLFLDVARVIGRSLVSPPVENTNWTLLTLLSLGLRPGMKLTVNCTPGTFNGIITLINREVTVPEVTPCRLSNMVVRRSSLRREILNRPPNDLTRLLKELTLPSRPPHPLSNLTSLLIPEIWRPRLKAHNAPRCLPI